MAWNELWRSDRHTKTLSYSALASTAATRFLSNNSLINIDQVRVGLADMSLQKTVLEQHCPTNGISECVPGKYRSYSGHCNNVREPLWGAAYEPLKRLKPAVYADGIEKPRQLSNSQGNPPLPSPRLISNKLLNGSTASTKGQKHSCSLLLAQWAQFIYEDIARLGTNRIFSSESSRNSASIPMPCCAEQHPECLPIITDTDDLPYRARGQCLPYARSMAAPRLNCSLGPREQANLVSSFIDGSHIYGSNEDETSILRTFSNGLMKTNPQPSRQDLLPPDLDNIMCQSTSSFRPCFLSASRMTNLLPTAAALHTIWVRQHNRLARNLKIINPIWEDERLFQEARRIVIAQLQHITFNEFLPILLGKDRLRENGLQLRRNIFDSDYNIKTNPGTLNEYASSAGLFFFSLFPGTLGFTDSKGEISQQRATGNLFNDPSSIYQKGRLEGIIRTLLHEPITRLNTPHIDVEFRDKFMRGPDKYGVDLAAMIIQMGRDHGLDSFTSWRKLCGLSRPTSFTELQEVFLPESPLEFTSIYPHVDDIDFFVGGLAERPLPGAFLGPTFSCIIERQFERLRHGDRFWYENFFEPSAFTLKQLSTIRESTMAGVICDNTDDIGMIQPNVFQQADNYLNCPIDCNTTSIIPRLNLNHWRDEEHRSQLPITKETLEKAVRLGAEQFRRLQEAESGRLNRQPRPTTGDLHQIPSALFTHASLMAPKRESLDIALTAGILSETTKILIRGVALNVSERLPSELSVETLQRLLPEVDVSRVVGNFTALVGGHTQNRKECLPKPLPCDHTAIYRTFSGWCNNLQFPHFGNAFEPLRRILDPVYDDGFDLPRTKGRNGKPLPSARHVSNLVHLEALPENESESRFHVKFSHMVMQFGQILDHDMTHSPVARGPNNAILNCSRCDSFDTLSVHCFPIQIDPSDPHFPGRHSDGSPRCMPFTRSLLGQLTLGYRNQLNQLTSFLDASYIYGSTECEANALRLFNRGRMNFTNLGYNKQALPQGLQERDCLSRPQFSCFNAGDERSNEQPGLTVLHTIFLRQHNQIALALSKINNFWSDEQIFQETRRILIAKLQHVVYNEWLPVVLGCELMARYDLMPRKSGYYEGYDPNCDASISQEFATAAMRFGHTLIRNVFPRMNSSYNHGWEGVKLETTFNNASPIYDENNGHMESILMGLLGSAGMDYDRFIVDAVRNHLFQRPGGPLTGLDLPAVNMQRGRDHGIPPYNSYRQICGFERASNFEDLLDTMDEAAVNALKAAYASVDDVDLFPGIMSEKPLKGALVGPMLACILAEQFQRLKRCDRFFYENSDPINRFTPGIIF
uniref:Peroxidase n=1 Tax=Meloidogyne incognita TaxID=6306 RepID=A0A914KR44_MELIC